MKPTADSIFDQIRRLGAEIDAMDDDNPLRNNLMSERDRLRGEARSIANSSRHPRSLEAERAMLLARLGEIEALFVTKGYAEKHLTKGFSDPGAYSATINRKLASDHASEIAAIDERLSELDEIRSASGSGSEQDRDASGT